MPQRKWNEAVISHNISPDFVRTTVVYLQNNQERRRRKMQRVALQPLDANLETVWNHLLDTALEVQAEGGGLRLQGVFAAGGDSSIYEVMKALVLVVAHELKIEAVFAEEGKQL